MEGHHIICGFGRIGSIVAKELLERMKNSWSLKRTLKK